MKGLAYLYRRLIPEYWFSINDNPQSYEQSDQYLDGRIKAIPEGKSFVFIADPHIFELHKRPPVHLNCDNTAAIVGYIRELTDIKTVVMGGDIIERGQNKYLGLQELLVYMNEMKAAFGEDFLVVHGNHDLNTPNVKTEEAADFMISYAEVERVLFSHIDRKCEDVSGKIAYLGLDDQTKKELMHYSRLHYYIDDDDKKIRYIILDTGCPGFGRNGCVEELFGVYNNGELILQYDWLYETLMSTPRDYDVAVFGHALVGYGGDERIPGVTLGICKILSGYKTKSRVTVHNCFSDNPRVTAYYAAGDHMYDFSDAVGSGSVAVVAADVHWDVQTVADYDMDGNFISRPYGGEELSETAIVVNVVQTDSLGCSRYEKAYKMEKGTSTEQCFDVVTILKNGDIAFTRIGAGKDRTVRYKK